MAWLTDFGHAAGRLFGQGVDLLYPPQCAICRAEVAEGRAAEAVVCDACRDTLADDSTRCRHCGDTIRLPSGDGHGDDAGTLCRRCDHRPRYDGIVALAGYDADIRSAVLAAKRPGGEFHAAGLATLLLDRHRAMIDTWRPDLVVPVPMHWLRRFRRGTSSADLLARQLGRGLGLASRAILRRTRATPMQNELPPDARAANVRGAFHASSAASGRRILLVDDVMTTGSTLDACRDALLAAGAARVFMAVITRADRGMSQSDEEPVFRE